MIIADMPADEAKRLDALRASGLLDSEPESRFDDLVRHAAGIAGTPTALISLVDEDRQWFKARHGFTGEETPRDLAFCAHTILGDGPLVVEDTTLDDRFHDNPLVADFPNIRFYAGFPITGPSGHRFGTLCVIDNTPRSLAPDQMELIGMLACQAEAQIELRVSLLLFTEADNSRSALLQAMVRELHTTYEGVVSAHRHLTETNLSTEQQWYLDHSIDSTHHLVTVIEDLVGRL
jgi:GAF domain-containing protein